MKRRDSSQEFRRGGLTRKDIGIFLTFFDLLHHQMHLYSWMIKCVLQIPSIGLDKCEHELYEYEGIHNCA